MARRVASGDWFLCHGGGGLASLPSDYSGQASSVRSAPAPGPTRRRARSTPGRGYGGDLEEDPFDAGGPMAASSFMDVRPADETFTIDRRVRGAHGYALDETFQAGPYALDETFTIDQPDDEPPPPPPDLATRTAWFDNRRYEHLEPVMQGPHPLEPDEMGAQSTPGMPTVARVGRYAHSSPGAGYAPCTPQTPIPPGFVRPPQSCPQYSPGSSWSSGYNTCQSFSTPTSTSTCPVPSPVAWNIPWSPPGSPPPVPPPVAWNIPWSPPRTPQPQSPRERSPSPQPGPSGLQQPVDTPRRGPRPTERTRFEDPLRVGLGIPPRRIVAPAGPEGLEMIEPIMQGILRMLDYGLETMSERQQRVLEIRATVTRMQGNQEDALRRLREFRGVAIESIEGYLRRATEAWNSLSDHYRDIVLMAKNLAPYPALQGIGDSAVVNQEEYAELVQRAAILARSIERELCSDTASLGQLVNMYDNMENDLAACKNFIPNFLQYINWAVERTETIRDFLTCSQAQFDRFMEEWRRVQPQLPVPAIDELKRGDPRQPNVFQDLTVDAMSVSTATPSPPTSPRRATFSPRVSPGGYDLPRTPPDLPGRVQTWMRKSSPSQLPPENIPYLQSIFDDYNQLENQAVNEYQNSTNESESLNASMNAMGGQQSSD